MVVLKWVGIAVSLIVLINVAVFCGAALSIAVAFVLNAMS